MPEIHLLWDAYKKTRFKWLSAPQKASTFCIVTGFNPRSIVLSETENLKHQTRLTDLLCQLNLDYQNIIAGDNRLDYHEPSLAINCDLNRGIALAKEFGQNAIYFVENDQLWLIPALLEGFSKEKLGNFSSALL